MAVDLLEFQRDLWTRLQKARTTDVVGARLGVSSAGQRWLLPLTQTDSIMPLPPVASIPAVQSWYSGLVNVRGNLYGVIDLSEFIGSEPTIRNMNTRIVVVAQKLKVNAAIMVSNMLGLQNLNRFKLRQKAKDAPAWVKAEYVDEPGQTWREIDLAALTANPRFMEVAAHDVAN
jgi:twitching motility protein PilI